jgi:carbamoyltransferase
MLLVAQVNESQRIVCDDARLTGIEKLKVKRSNIPAVTHVDYSARIQTVRKEQNPLLYELMKRFEARTGCGVLVNTSFNVRGEPIVCSPDDAYRCFVNTEMDYLVIGSFILDRLQQPAKKPARTFEPVPD